MSDDGERPNDLDVTDEPYTPSDELRVPQSRSLAHRRETVRGWLAFTLTALVGLQVLGALAAVIAGVAVDDMVSLLEHTLTPTIALAGPSIGFYFAGQGGEGF
jgi:hypothetical protein